MLEAMPPASRSFTRRRAILAGGVAAVLVVAGLGIRGIGEGGPQPEPGSSSAMESSLPSFPSVAPLAPGSTPQAAATIPLVKPGFPFIGDATWQLSRPSSRALLIEGFASAPSYLPGQQLRLAVSTSAGSYDVSIFRVSGEAPEASPFEVVARLPGQPGGLQAGPVVDPITKMVSAPWSYSTTFAIPTDWPSGVYLARLESDQHAQSYVPFVVRSARPTRFLVVSNALTWQAYNTWGGSSLYTTTVGQPLAGVTRALAVTFDRPYASNGGAGQLFSLELPMIAWMERQRLDVSFTTDYDLSMNPDTQPLPRVVIFNGHGEYWGVPLRRWLERHVLQQGDLNVGSFAANTGYWPVVLSGVGAGEGRVVTCYKNGPIPGKQAVPSADPGGSIGPSEMPPDSGSGDEQVGSGSPVGTFPPAGPYVGPYIGSYLTQSLLGVSYEHVTTAMAEYLLANPVPEPSVLAGTGLAPGSPLGFFAGGEVDAVDRGAGVADVAAGTAGGVVAEAYGIPSRNGGTSTAEAVYRSLASGARVFASGTFYWGWALDPGFAAAHDVTPGFERLTLNLLALLGG
jgi:hypothetical protein